VAILAAAVLWGTTGTASTLAPAGARPAAIGSAGLAAGGLLLFLTSRGARSLPAACTGAQRWLLGLGRRAGAAWGQVGRRHRGCRAWLRCPGPGARAHRPRRPSGQHRHLARRA